MKGVDRRVSSGFWVRLNRELGTANHGTKNYGTGNLEPQNRRTRNGQVSRHCYAEHSPSMTSGANSVLSARSM
jgi:hypothetical protein